MLRVSGESPRRHVVRDAFDVSLLRESFDVSASRESRSLPDDLEASDLFDLLRWYGVIPSLPNT